VTGGPSASTDVEPPGSLVARRARWALVALVFVLGVCTGSGATDAQTGAPGPVDPRLFVIGDSVIVGASATITQRLPGWRVSVYAQEGFSTLAAPSVIAASGPLIGEVVVVGLGNNDAGNPATFAGRIDGVMRSLPGVRRVIWVNLRRFRDFVPALDAELANAPARWPNLEIADWDARATPDPSLVYGDGLHLTPAGQAAMAELIAQHLDAYVRSRTPASTTTTTTTVTRPPSSDRVPRRQHGSRHRRGPDSGVPVYPTVGIGVTALLAVAITGARVRARRARRAPTAAP
jgi:hypothetical protein